MDESTNVLALAKRETGEQYIIFYDDAGEAEAMRAMGRWAADEELSFTWYDAALLSTRARAIANAKKAG